MVLFKKVSCVKVSIIYLNHNLLNLFKDMNKVVKDHKLHSSLDNIKFRYGKNSVLRGSSLTDKSTTIARNTMVGGHNG